MIYKTSRNALGFNKIFIDVNSSAQNIFLIICTCKKYRLIDKPNFIRNLCYRSSAQRRYVDRSRRRLKTLCEKGENAGNQHFLLFHNVFYYIENVVCKFFQCLLPYWSKTSFIIWMANILSSAHTLNFIVFKILSFGNDLTTIFPEHTSITGNSCEIIMVSRDCLWSHFSLNQTEHVTLSR